MIVLYYFDWDENKNRINLEKHGITFEEASTVFFDDRAILFDDPEHSIDEDRFLLLGMSETSKVCIPVNEKLSEIFLQLHISEKSGRGVPKIIEVYGKDAFNFRENSIVVTIPFQRIHNPQIALGNKTGDKKPLNERRRKIITEMRNDPNIITAQLRVILGCAETTVENNISYLRKNGYIERVGSRKSGYWKVI